MENFNSVKCNANNVAVLLAAYNGEEFIREQLDSILNQQQVNLTIFVSVDLSNDNTLDIINEYSAKHLGAFNILPYGKQYGSAGQNFFRLLTDTDLSSYQYVSFADQDDIWLPNKLSRAVECIREMNLDGYSSNVEAFWADGKSKLVKKNTPQVNFDHLFESSGPGCTFVMTNKLATATQLSLQQNRENINRLWLHDWFCYSFARVNQFKWFIDEQPLMLYRQHDTNSVGANSGLSSFISRCSVISKGEGFNKVIEQSDFIGKQDLPVTLLKSGSRRSMLRLSSMSFRCRRKKIDKLFFFIVCILFACKGYQYVEK